jgi:protein-tyrosine phosphatase
MLPHETIYRGVSFMLEQKVLGKKVLVACGAGISRSSTFALAALMQDEKLAIFDAYREVFLRYRGAEPHPELMMSLSAYHGKEMDLLEAWEGLHAVRESIQGGAGV